MKRCRRHLILITLLLLVGAGAVVNVAVAWGIAAVGPMAASPWRVDRPSKWLCQAPCDWPEAPQERKIYPAFGALTLAEGGYSESPEGVVLRFVARYEAGWPVGAVRLTGLESLIPSDDGGLHVTERSERRWWIDGILIPEQVGAMWFKQSFRRLPVMPMFPGFAINTLFYTAILALPLSFFPIRRRLRARRGRCPKCGYDLAGLAGAEKGAEAAAPCPECGSGRMKAEG